MLNQHFSIINLARLRMKRKDDGAGRIVQVTTAPTSPTRKRERMA